MSGNIINCRCKVVYTIKEDEDGLPILKNITLFRLIKNNLYICDMEFKQLSYDLKDLDTAKGVVKAYANVYNFKDSDGDISAYGSFDKTVSENFKRIRVLKDHNPTMMIGVPLAIDTKDSYGLFTTTQFNLKKI